MSRRLAISSLLCDDDSDAKPEHHIIDPVVLAPHLRRSPKRVEINLTASPSQPPASSNTKRIGLDALVHAASAAAAAEEQNSRLFSGSIPTSSQSPYGYDHLQQRQQQQLEQRVVHREQILGYHEPQRPGGPGMRDILGPGPGMLTEEHLHKKRRYSDEHSEYHRSDDQGNRLTSISALTSPSVPRITAGYDPVHENDKSYRYWDREERPPYPHQYTYPAVASSVQQYLNPPLPSSFSPQQHRVISPVGRRSPPGSQTGRAIAAKKVEQELQLSVESSLARSDTPEIKVKRESSSAPEPFKKKPRKPSHTKEVSTTGPSVKPEVFTSIPPSPPAQQRREEDPHEWFLEQYADDGIRRKIKRPHSSGAPSSSTAIMPPLVSTKSDPGRRSTASPVAQKPHSPVMPSTLDSGKRSDGDDAMMALEQELDAELAGVVNQKAPVYDADAMDIDGDLAQLVDQTLGPGTENASASALRGHRTPREAKVDDEDQGDTKNKDKAMDVDVEDELLSLLDEQSNLRMSASASTQNTNAPSGPSVSIDVNSTNSKAKTLPAHELNGEETEVLRSLSPARPASASGVRSSSAKLSEEKDDEETMPPPSAPKDKPEAAVAVAQAKKRGKPGPKPKPRNPDGTIVGTPPAKPRAKPGPKPKPRDEFGNIIRASAFPTTTVTTVNSRASSSATPAPPIPPPQVSRTASGSYGARSRSTSVLPGGSVDPDGEVQDEKEDQEEEDDKLYCLCKAKYDEDKPMIACDSCDEWYHMKCVEIPEHMGDLVDQFFCPPCIEKSPSIQLKTTYKRRCLCGLDSPDPDSPKACHKPARTFSKYCSDECGVKNIRKRIDGYTKKGGKKEDLWETVKAASKREGLVRVIEPSPAMQIHVDGANVIVEGDFLKPIIKEIQPMKSKQEREIERLNGLLADIEKVRDGLRRAMDIILWREKLLQLATDRSESLGQCGWDQRLCFSDEDWADYGEGVLESYAEQGEGAAGEEGEWWCPGDQDCERHTGWQRLRVQDVDKEKEKNEEAVFKLISREREIRKRIDRIEEQEAGPFLGTAPRKQKGSKLSNGHSAKTKVNGDASKKGKKRKAPS